MIPELALRDGHGRVAPANPARENSTHTGLRVQLIERATVFDPVHNSMKRSSKATRTKSEHDNQFCQHHTGCLFSA